MKTSQNLTIALHLLLASLPMLLEMAWQPHPDIVLGVRARDFSSWPYIFTAPFAHGGPAHLFANLSGLWILGAGLLHFYPRRGVWLFWLLPFLSTIPVWLWARPAVHLGASGWVFGLIGLLLVGGLRRRNRRGLALAGAVLVLYGGTLAGIFPTEPYISWESHLSGLLLGALLGWLWLEVPPETRMDASGKAPETGYQRGFQPIAFGNFRYTSSEPSQDEKS